MLETLGAKLTASARVDWRETSYVLSGNHACESFSVDQEANALKRQLCCIT